MNTLVKCGLFLVSISLLSLGHAQTKPSRILKSYSGKFEWIKVGNLNMATIKGFRSVKTAYLEVTFPKGAELKKDRGGYGWFTFVVAEQFSDYKWHQSTKSAMVPVTGTKVLPGTYTLPIDLSGIPTLPAGEKTVVVSVGPNTSGLVKPIPMTISDFRSVPKK